MNKVLHGFLSTLLCVSFVVSVAAAEEAGTHHVVFAPDQIQWMDAPPILPAGAKMAVLKGDPSQEAIFVVRLSAPAGWRVMPHWHPTTENVTVISGTFGFGAGDAFDKAKGEKLPPGGFVSIPPTHHHWAWAETDMVIQISGMGPFQLYYLDPKDDPTKMAKKSEK